MAALGSKHLEPGKEVMLYHLKTFKGQVLNQDNLSSKELWSGRLQVVNISGMGPNLVDIGILKIAFFPPS